MRKWLARLALAAAGTALVLAGGEAFVRWRYGSRFAAKIRPVEQDVPESIADDPETVYRPNGNLDYVHQDLDFEMHVRTDAFGARLGRLGEVDEDEDIVILCGDSYAAGWGVSTADSAASFLDELIYAGTGHAVRLVNLGVAGYSTMQSARRLAQFLRERAHGEVRALVFVHCQNDLGDNVRLDMLGLMHGLVGHGDRRKRDRTELPASPSHLWNLVWVWMHPRRELAGPVGDPPELPFRRHLKPGTPVPDEFTIEGRTFRTADFTEENTAWSLANERRVPSALQRRMLEISIAMLHRAVDGLGIEIYHTTIYSAPDWFAALVSEVVGEAPAHGNRVIDLGKLPQGEVSGPIDNPHSGGHFTPRFNRVWAESLFAALCEHQPGLFGG